MALRDLTRMAFAFLTLKVMPESPEINLDELSKKLINLIQEYTESTNPENTKVEYEPIAFGLKATILKFAVDEAKGGTDSLEEKIAALEEVANVEVTGISRALG